MNISRSSVFGPQTANPRRKSDLKASKSNRPEKWRSSNSRPMAFSASSRVFWVSVISFQPGGGWLQPYRTPPGPCPQGCLRTDTPPASPKNIPRHAFALAGIWEEPARSGATAPPGVARPAPLFLGRDGRVRDRDSSVSPRPDSVRLLKHLQVFLGQTPFRRFLETGTRLLSSPVKGDRTGRSNFGEAFRTTRLLKMDAALITTVFRGPCGGMRALPSSDSLAERKETRARAFQLSAGRPIRDGKLAPFSETESYHHRRFRRVPIHWHRNFTLPPRRLIWPGVLSSWRRAWRLPCAGRR